MLSWLSGISTWHGAIIWPYVKKKRLLWLERIRYSCVPEENSYQGNRRRFWPFLKKIAAKFAVKLELALHSMAPTLPKTPNAKIKLIELFQLKSLNRPQSLCNLGVQSPSRLEKCLFSKHGLSHKKSDTNTSCGYFDVCQTYFFQKPDLWAFVRSLQKFDYF